MLNAENAPANASQGKGWLESAARIKEANSAHSRAMPAAVTKSVESGAKKEVAAKKQYRNEWTLRSAEQFYCCRRETYLTQLGHKSRILLR